MNIGRLTCLFLGNKSLHVTQDFTENHNYSLLQWSATARYWPSGLITQICWGWGPVQRSIKPHVGIFQAIRLSQRKIKVSLQPPQTKKATKVLTPFR